MARITVKPIAPSVGLGIANETRQRVVLATARVEKAMTQKVSTPGPPRSKPGEPPHIDTAQLIQSIHSSLGVEGSMIRGTVTANKEYAAGLEYGTPKTAARPFARATLAQEQPNIVKILGAPGLVKAL